ncbi:hypothetical protein L195_g034428, partial [Trifolium pratense]
MENIWKKKGSLNEFECPFGSEINSNKCSNEHTLTASAYFKNASIGIPYLLPNGVQKHVELGPNRYFQQRCYLFRYDRKRSGYGAGAADYNSMPDRGPGVMSGYPGSGVTGPDIDTHTCWVCAGGCPTLSINE